MKEGQKADQGNDLIRHAITQMNGGFDVTLSANAIQDTMQALALQATWLLKETKDGFEGKGNSKDMTASHIAMSMAKISKSMDDIVRLSAFVSGHADSRPDTGQGILQGLKDWQITQVNTWVEENEAEKRAPGTAESR